MISLERVDMSPNGGNRCAIVFLTTQSIVLVNKPIGKLAIVNENNFMTRVTFVSE